MSKIMINPHPVLKGALLLRAPFTRPSQPRYNLKCLPFAVAVLGGLLTAVNPAFAAQTWTQTSAPSRNWTWVASSADGNKLVAAAYNNGIYTSTNSGATWKQTSAPAEPWFGVTSSADGSKLVAYFTLFRVPPFGDPYGGSIYTSMDSGTTWAMTSAPNLPWFGLASSADGSKAVAVAHSDSIYTSTNSGTTWTMTSAPSGAWDSVASSADGTKLVAGLDNGGIYTSTDSGATWIAPGNLQPTGHWQAIASSADGNKLVAAPDNDNLFTSTNSGNSWNRTSAPINSWGVVASSADGIRLVAVAVGGRIYASTNSGATWTTASAPIAKWHPVASSADGSKLVASTSSIAQNSPGPIYTSQSTLAPLLSITPSASDAVLSWTVPSMDFVLQQNSDLTTTNWTDVPTIPTLTFTNLQNQVIVALVNRFYRLKNR